MTSRYVIKTDERTESYKIIDMGTLIGTEDMDHEWVASAYERPIAEHICQLLNNNPHAPNNRTKER